MIKALAPGTRRGCSWVWLSVALAGGLPAAVDAQDRPKASGSAKKDGAAAAKTDGAAAKTDKADDAPPEADDEAPAPSQGNSKVEVFKDPRAEKAMEALKNTGFRRARPQVVGEVRRMASKESPVNRETIQQFVQGMAFELTDKGNINELISPPPGKRPKSGPTSIQEAADNLIDAMNVARASQNTSFLSTYNQVLIDTLPRLLNNHLVARIEAMIVLGQTGSPAVAPICVAQLKDPNQTVWVKLWAARALTNVVDGGRRLDQIPTQDAIAAAKALADFLNNEKDAPWPAQWRALEAIGALRQSAVPADQQKVEMAATAMRFLADPEAKPEVRAQAAWALGMVQVNPSVKYNFGLVGYDVGRLAADIGQQINEVYDSNRVQAQYLAGLLVSPVYQAFNGMDGVRESGLLHVPAAHPTIGPALNTIRQAADLESAVARAAVELMRSPNGQIPNRRKDLGDRVGALKSFLEKNTPKDYHLVPGPGPEYRPEKGEQVAGDPADAPKVSGVPRGR